MTDTTKLDYIPVEEQLKYHYDQVNCCGVCIYARYDARMDITYCVCSKTPYVITEDCRCDRFMSIGEWGERNE